MTLTRLLTCKTELPQGRIETLPLAPPAAGEALLAIRRIALTTNNITYAAFGEAMNYWQFFPTGAAEWGQIPAWGYADVVESMVDGVAAGERYYGYWPIASHLTLQPVRVSERAFQDGAAHRQVLSSAYNQYIRCRADPAYRVEDEALQMLLRPLFTTSFVLADHLRDQQYFGAARIVVSSASSKTAYGTAHCLPGAETIALTSPRHREFVAGLGCYARTATYDQLEQLPTDQPVLYVDFSGDATLRARVHRHFGAALVHDCAVGSAQTTTVGSVDATLPGPAPAFFFAPAQIKKRNADWGPAVFNQRCGDAQRAFLRHVGDAGWLHVEVHRGFEAARTLIAELCAGHVDPRLGHVVELG